MAAPTQFDIARKRAEQQSRASIQSQQEALKRRFASMGAAGSGAALKQEQLAAEKGQEQLAGQMEAIGAEEQKEEQRKAEIQQAQQFQSGEAEKARQFAIAEREASQKFQTENTAKQQAFQERVQAWNESQAGKEMDLAMQQFQQDKETTEFNRRLSIATAAREGIGTEELMPMAPSAAGGMAAAPQAAPTLSSSSSNLLKRYESGNNRPSEKEIRTARAKMTPQERALFDRQIKSIDAKLAEYEAVQTSQIGSA